MEVGLFKEKGEVWTRFKLRTKSVPTWAELLKNKYHVDIEKPYKQSSVYTYFKAKGDLLNAR